jgi:hypothetical protein
MQLPVEAPFVEVAAPGQQIPTETAPVLEADPTIPDPPPGP